MSEQLEFDDYQETELDGSELVLCATSRLAAELRRRYDARQAGRGLKQWPTLETSTPPQWLDRMAEAAVLRGVASDAALSRPVLGTFEEKLVWERIIAESLTDPSAPLFDIASMATTAAEAHTLSVIWEINVSGFFLTDECQRFTAWQASFMAYCNTQKIIDAAQYQRAVVASLKSVELALPKKLVIAGFDRFSPLETRLCTTLAARGVPLHKLQTESVAAVQQRALSYPDRAAECLAVALWVQQQLTANPEARLGVVAPDLAGVREILQDTLEDVLEPASLRPSHAEAPHDFNFSLGKALVSFPIVSTALDLLRLVARPAGFEQSFVGNLLQSPYWSADMSEMDGRARLEAAMRQGLGWTTSLKKVASYARWLNERDGLSIGQLVRQLDALDKASATLAKRARPSAWAASFRTMLNTAGWPGERTLSSHEFQARQAFFEELGRLGVLDPITGEVDANEALARLAQLCRQRIFQPKTEGLPRVQILGVLEAAGMSFSALWVMGMNDNAWPPQARPNPLLPAEAQRMARSPHASAEVQLAFAQAIQSRLLGSAPSITFSWPRMDGATELRPSPLMSSLFPDEKCEAPASPTWVADAVATAGAALATPFEDALAPPVNEGEKVSGGTWLLRAQAICPAWGYFQYRLGGGKLKEPVEGLDASARGTLVHDVLEVFWTQVKTSHALKALGEAKLAQAVETAVDQVLEAFGQDKKREPLNTRFKKLERVRLIKLINGWLTVELSRTEPFTVLACEREAKPEIEGITARMFIDRIDQLEDGRLLVIDYKTGASIDYKSWAAERITEPQLPIYAAIARPAEGEVAAVAFAKVLLNDPVFVGIAEADGLLPGITHLDSKAGEKLFNKDVFPDWATVLTHWQTAIEAIAREVKAGDAAVRFEDESDLKYCDVLPILRLPEYRVQMAASDKGIGA